MKGKLKKLTAVILSLILLGSAGIFTGLTAFAENVPETVTEISVGQSVAVETNSETPAVWLKFTPTVTGPYSFFSFEKSSGDPKTWIYKYDSEGNSLQYVSEDDDDGAGNNFFYSDVFSAEETYYFKASVYYANYGTYKATLVHNHFDSDNDGKCNYPGCNKAFVYTAKEDEPITLELSAGENAQLNFACPKDLEYRLILDYDSDSDDYVAWDIFDSDGQSVRGETLAAGNNYTFTVSSWSNVKLTATATVSHKHYDNDDDGKCDFPGCDGLLWINLTEDTSATITVAPDEYLTAYFKPETTDYYKLDVGDRSLEYAVYENVENYTSHQLSRSWMSDSYNTGDDGYFYLQAGTSYRFSISSYYSPKEITTPIAIGHFHSGDDEQTVVAPTNAAFGVRSIVCNHCNKTIFAEAYPSFSGYECSGVQDGFIYAIYNDGEGNREALIYGYNGEETEIVFPAEIDGAAVTSIGDFDSSMAEYGLFSANPAIKSITIPEGVQSINPCAFSFLTGLEQVTIPDSVAVIESYAFCDCVNLATITMGKGVKYIGEGAFLLAPDESEKSYISDEVNYIDYYSPEYFERQAAYELEDQNYEFESMSDRFGTEITSWDDAYAFVDGATDEQIEAIFGTGTTKADAKAQIDKTKGYYDGQIAYYNSFKSLAANFTAGAETILDTEESPLERVMYAGSEDDWAAIITKDGNGQLAEAPRSYNGEGLYYAIFMADGKEVAKVTFTSGQASIAEPAVPAKAGYTGKWEAYTLNNADITINAVYTKEEVTYTVTFIADGKTVKTYKLAAGAKIPVPPAPTKAGYTFKEWSPKVPAKMPAKNMTFKAVFESAAKVTFEKSASVAYRTKVTITATGENLPKGTVLAIYEKGDSKPLAKGSAKSVSYEAGEMKSAKTYEVKVIDSKGNAQKGLGGEIKIDVTGTGFFQRIIAFFKYLFSPVPTKTVGPKVK